MGRICRLLSRCALLNAWNTYWWSLSAPCPSLTCLVRWLAQCRSTLSSFWFNITAGMSKDWPSEEPRLKIRIPRPSRGEPPTKHIWIETLSNWSKTSWQKNCASKASKLPLRRTKKSQIQILNSLAKSTTSREPTLFPSTLDLVIWLNSHSLARYSTGKNSMLISGRTKGSLMRSLTFVPETPTSWLTWDLILSKNHL